MKIRNLLFLVALPLSGSVFTFDSNSASFNNANSTTIDEGASPIPGADMLAIDPSYGETVVGFGIFGHFNGIATGGTFTVDVPDGVAVQFDGEWIQQFNLGSGVQSFTIPTPWIQNDFSAIVYGPGQAAFSVEIDTAAVSASSPEPATVLLCLLGLAVLAARRIQ